MVPGLEALRNHAIRLWILGVLGILGIESNPEFGNDLIGMPSLRVLCVLVLLSRASQEAIAS